MVTKTKAGGKKGKVQVGNLPLNKETVKDLSKQDAKEIKGGAGPGANTVRCSTTCNTQVNA